MIFATGSPALSRTRVFLDAVPNPRIFKPFAIDELEVLIRSMMR